MRINVWILLLVLSILMSPIWGTVSALSVKEDLGQHVISFSTPLIDKVKVLPMERNQTNSGLNYQSYGLELFDSSGPSLGKILVTQFAGSLVDKASDTRKKELANMMRDNGCTEITNQDIKVDRRSGILVACESNDLFVFEYRISSSTTVLGIIYLPWNDSTRGLIDTLKVTNND